MANMTRQPENGKVREAAPNAVRQAGDAGAELVRGNAETAQRATEATGEIAQRATAATGEVVRRAEAASARMMEESAARTAKLAEVLPQPAAAAREGAEAASESLQGGMAEMWRMMLPGGPAGVREMQGAILGFYTEAMRANLRMAQDMLRMMDPSGLLHGQQKAVHQMLDAMLAGQATMFGGARKAGEAEVPPAAPPR